MPKLLLLMAAAMIMLVGTPALTFAQGLQILWYDPARGPICAGPLGPGPCALVAQWIANHQPAPHFGPLGAAPAVPLPQSNGSIPVPSEMSPLTVTLPTNSVTGALQCAQMTGQNQQVNVNTFLACTRGALVLNQDSMTLVNCAEQANGNASTLATCAGQGIIGSRLTQDQTKVVGCASRHSDDEDDFASCVAQGLLGDQLNSRQRAIL